MRPNPPATALPGQVTLTADAVVRPDTAASPVPGWPG